MIDKKWWKCPNLHLSFDVSPEYVFWDRLWQVVVVVVVGDSQDWRDERGLLNRLSVAGHTVQVKSEETVLIVTPTPTAPPNASITPRRVSIPPTLK